MFSNFHHYFVTQTFIQNSIVNSVHFNGIINDRRLFQLEGKNKTKRFKSLKIKQKLVQFYILNSQIENVGFLILCLYIEINSWTPLEDGICMIVPEVCNSYSTRSQQLAFNLRKILFFLGEKLLQMKGWVYSVYKIYVCELND